MYYRMFRNKFKVYSKKRHKIKWRRQRAQKRALAASTTFVDQPQLIDLLSVKELSHQLTV